MTMNVEHPIAQHVGDGVKKEFAYNYTVTDKAWIQIFIDDSDVPLSITSYGVNLDTKIITFNIAPDLDAVIRIIRSIPLNQLVDYTAYDPFPAETHEGALDRLTMILQDNMVLAEILVSAPLDAADVKTAYESNDHTEEFSTDEKAKLAGLEPPHFKGSYPNEAALLVAHPNGLVGDYAFVRIVDADTMYIWDIQWTLLGHTSIPLTAEQLKTLYESNANTEGYTTSDQTLVNRLKDSRNIKADYESNVGTEGFSTAEKNKLAGIQEGATVHLTENQIISAIDSAPNSNTFTDTEKAKLLGIDANASDDQTASEIASSYEGISGVERFTSAEKTKLAGVSGALFKGTFNSLALLQAAHPAPNEEGSYAFVHDGGNEHIYLWDAIGSDWDLSATAGGGGSMTDAMIKTAYERNPDTNAFSDAKSSKLTDIGSRTIGIEHEDASGPAPERTTINQPIWMINPQVINPDYDTSKDSPELITIGNVARMMHDSALEKPMTTTIHHHFTVADMQAMHIGGAQYVYTEPQPQYPGAPPEAIIAASALEDFGILHQGHPFVNAIVMRMSHNIWSIISQEFTGSPHTPTIMFLLNLGAKYDAGHGTTVIGLLDEVSFKSEVLDLEHSIGDRDAFGAQTVIEKIQKLELDTDLNAQRMADIHGDTGHVVDSHTTLIHVNNNGLTFCVANDRPTDAEHVGIDIFDGNQHKVKFVFDEASPFSAGTPFDPAHVIDGANIANWITGTKPQLFMQKGTDFRRFVDPVTGSILTYSTVQAFIIFSSIVTLRWAVDTVNPHNSMMEVHKVAHAAVHTSGSLAKAILIDGSVAMLPSYSPSTLGDVVNKGWAEHFFMIKDPAAFGGDLNTLMSNESRLVTAAASNKPSALKGTIIIVGDSIGESSQIFVDSAGKTFIRSHTGATAWKAWGQMGMMSYNETTKTLDIAL